MIGDKKFTKCKFCGKKRWCIQVLGMIADKERNTLTTQALKKMYVCEDCLEK